MDRLKNEDRGYLTVLLAAALWAILTPGSRLLLELGVEPTDIVFWRCAFAWAFFTLHLLLAGRGRDPAGIQPLPSFRILPADIPGIAAFAVLGVAVLYLSVSLAVEAGGAALASILLYTAPGWVAVLAWPLLGERLTQRKIIALVLTLIGIAAFGLSDADGTRPTAAAVGWGLLSGLSYAFLSLFGKRYFERYSAPTIFFWALPLAALLVAPGAAFTPKPPTAWLTLLLLGGVSTYGAYLAYSAGLRRLEATRASVVATLEPVLAALLAFAIWGERFAVYGYAGAVSILIGVILMTTATSAHRPAASRS